jgi:8-oxo-dGTP pyrophosphatase MutT (NUDIX family)
MAFDDHRNFPSHMNKVVMSFQTIVNALYYRFLSGLSPAERLNKNYVMHWVQQTYWYYVDYLQSPYHRTTFQQFVERLAPHFQWVKGDVAEIIREFWKHNATLPRAGGVLLSPDRTKVLVVRSCHGKRWSFPLGKLNPEESSEDCAQREVFEETGYAGIPYSHQVLTFHKKKAFHALYLFVDVPEDYPFYPQTMHEIAEVKWVEVNAIQDFVQNVPKIQEKLYKLISQLSYPLQRIQHLSPTPITVSN